MTNDKLYRVQVWPGGVSFLDLSSVICYLSFANELQAS
jgi:hypothetical protein